MGKMKEEDPFVMSETFRALHVGGDMILEGRKMCLRAMRKPPWIPDVVDLGARLRQSTEVMELSEAWRTELLAQMIHTYRAMERRAIVQGEYAKDPRGYRNELVEEINGLRIGNRVKRKEITVGWGLFSMAIMAPGDEFEKLKQMFHGGGDGEGEEGNVWRVKGWLAQNLGHLFTGPIYIIRRDGSERATLSHEDGHGWQVVRREIGKGFVPHEVEGWPAVCRAVDYEQIRDSDEEDCRRFLKEVVDVIKHNLSLEIPASLWSRNLPVYGSTTGLLDFKDVTLTAINNTLYWPRRELPAVEQIKRVFEAGLEVSGVNLYSDQVVGIVDRSVRRQSSLIGERNAHHRVASWVCMLPNNKAISPRLLSAVLLGRKDIGYTEVEVNWIGPLAVSLAEYARRTVDPDKYLRDGPLPGEDAGRFENVLVWTLSQEPYKYMGVVDKHARGGEDWERRLKEGLASFAPQHVPEDIEEEWRRGLRTRLGI